MPPRAKKKVRPVIRIDGLVLTLDDFTLAEWERIEAATGVPWYDTRPLNYARHAIPVLTEAVVRAGTSRTEAAKRVEAFTSRDTLEHIKLEEFDNADDRPADFVDGRPVIDPKADPAGAATTGS